MDLIVKSLVYSLTIIVAILIASSLIIYVTEETETTRYQQYYLLKYVPGDYIESLARQGYVGYIVVTKGGYLENTSYPRYVDIVAYGEFSRPMIECKIYVIHGDSILGSKYFDKIGAYEVLTANVERHGDYELWVLRESS